MNIVIIAAGKGSRIYKKVKKNKQLINIKEGILLKVLVKNAIKSGFTKIFVVVGYKSQIIKNTLREFKQVNFIYNKYYNKKEMFYSIICGLKKISGNTLISYSDIIYKKNLLDKIQNTFCRSSYYRKTVYGAQSWLFYTFCKKKILL